MDLKKRSNQVKEKVKSLGFKNERGKVSMGQCQEILAIANGFRNYRAMKNHFEGSPLKEAMDTILPTNRYITIKVDPNNTNQYYEDLIFAVKLKVDQKMINDFINIKDSIVKDSDITVNYPHDFTLIENFDGEHKSVHNYFEDEFEENEDIDMYLRDYLESVGSYIIDENFYKAKNHFEPKNIKDYVIGKSLNISKYGISVKFAIRFDHEEVIYSSYSIYWDELNLESKI